MHSDAQANPADHGVQHGQIDEAGYEVRHAARAVMLSPDNRVLLFRCLDPTKDNAREFWITPGGGLHEGETHQQAVRREVFEETGLTDFQLGPCIWYRRHAFRWMDRRLNQHERFYLVTTDRTDIVHDHRMDDELMALLEHRWWTTAEMREADTRFAPRRMADLIDTLLADGPGDEPIDVGV